MLRLLFQVLTSAQMVGSGARVSRFDSVKPKSTRSTHSRNESDLEPPNSVELAAFGWSLGYGLACFSVIQLG
ncbi:hypothetical protein Hanom_Chr00s000007g01614921 [Helianthus anomalus]